MNCILFHDWTDWSDMETLRVFENDTNVRPVGVFLLQKKACKKCKMIKVRKIKIS